MKPLPLRSAACLLIALTAVATAYQSPARPTPIEAAPGAPAASPVAYLPLVRTPVRVFRDDFSNPTSGWLDRDEGHAVFGYVGGEYRILVRTAGNAAWAWNDQAQGSDFRVEVDARGYSGSGYPGIAFNATTGGGYLYLAGDGKFTFLVCAAGACSTLLSLQNTPFVHAGSQSNRLKVVRNGSAIELYANGQQLSSLSDSTLSGGYVGVTALATADNYEARFDNFLAVFDPNDTTTTGASLPSVTMAQPPKAGRAKVTLR